MDIKVCKKCNIGKDISEYPKMGGKLCKLCFNEYMKTRRPKKEKEIVLIKIKVCKKCNSEKNIEDFNVGDKYKDGYRNYCKKCELLDKKKNYNKEYHREYYLTNKEQFKKYSLKNKDKVSYYQKIYRLKNKDKLSKSKKLYQIKNRELINDKICAKKQNSPLFKLSCNIRTLVSKNITKQGYTKKSKTYEILGCSFDYIVKYIEGQFKEWMSWENYGKYNGEINYGWDIDHIIPLCSARNENELLELFNYKNLRPVCSYHNRVIKRHNLL